MIPRPSTRPYITLSSAMSIDGYLDNALAGRLMLSNEADLDRVDAVRAQQDAVLVGAGTVRKDAPHLLIRDPARRRARVAAGLAASPAKVTITAEGDLDADSAFFTSGESPKLVYTPRPAASVLERRLGSRATVVPLTEPVTMDAVVDDLGERGIRRLMVEGGGSVHTQFLQSDLVDELQLVVAPFFVGDCRAPRLVGDGRFPWTPDRRARLAEVRQLGDVVLLRYALSDRCETP